MKSQRFNFSKILMIFIFTILAGLVFVACGDSDQKLVDKALETIEVGFAVGDTKDSVTKNLDLQKTVDTVQVAWVSGSPAVISNAGVVTRPAAETEVTLTATLTLGKAKETYVVKVKVKAAEVQIDPVIGLDLLKGWVENDPGTYAVAEGVTTVITYTKVAEQDWAFVKNEFDAADVAGMNTFTIVLKGSAGKKVLVKVNDSIEEWVTFENATTQETVVITADSIIAVIIFAEGGVAPANGSFEIISARAHFVEPEDIPDPIEELDLLKGWTERDEGTYAVVEGETTVVTYTKVAGQEWALVRNLFYAEDAAGFNTFTVVDILRDTAGKKVMVKVNDSIEEWVTFEENVPATVVVSAASITDVMIFAEGGDAPVNGSFEIISAKIHFVEVPFDPASELDLLKGWVENDVSTYAFVEGTTTVVNYTKGAGKEWAFVKNEFDVAEAIGMNTFTIVLKGSAGKKLMVKVNDKIEQWVTFEENMPATVVITADSITQVMLFAEGGDAPVNGSFEIISAKVHFEFSLLKGWIEKDKGTYTAAEGETTVVNYTKAAGQEWALIKNPFDPEDVAGLNTFTIVLKGSAGKKVLVKVNDLIQEEVIFEENKPVTVVITADSITQVMLFAEGGIAPINGSFEIILAKINFIEPEVIDNPKPELDLLKGWAENDTGTYVVVENATTVVTYTKIAGQEWSFMKNTFAVEDAAGLNTVTIVLKGSAGKKVLVKVSGIEKWITFVDDETLETAVVSAASITEVLLFAEGGDAPANGSIEIISAKAHFALDLLKGWKENDAGTYAVEEGETTVITYTKVATQEWAFVKNPFNIEDADGMNTLTIVLKGSAGQRILVKVNDLIEEWITFENSNPLKVVISAPSINGVIIFAEPDVVPANGSFEIISAKIHFVE